MDIKLEKWGDDLALPLPIEMVEKYCLKDGDRIDLSEEILRKLFAKPTDQSSAADSE